jgi:hypothetical protein
VNSKKLIERLPIVRENILEEAATQPARFLDAANYRVAAMRQRMQAVAKIEYFRSKAKLYLRRKKRDSGDKMTEWALADRVEVSPTHRRLRAEMEQAQQMEEFSKLIVEAYRMRRDAIRSIADAENTAVLRGSAELEGIAARRKLRDKARELARQRIAMDEDEEIGVGERALKGGWD